MGIYCDEECKRKAKCGHCIYFKIEDDRNDYDGVCKLNGWLTDDNDSCDNFHCVKKSHIEKIEDEDLLKFLMDKYNLEYDNVVFDYIRKFESKKP